MKHKIDHELWPLICKADPISRKNQAAGAGLTDGMDHFESTLPQRIRFLTDHVVHQDTRKKQEAAWAYIQPPWLKKAVGDQVAIELGTSKPGRTITWEDL